MESKFTYSGVHWPVYLAFSSWGTCLGNFVCNITIVKFINSMGGM